LMKTTRRYYRVDRRHISMLRFTFEAYEGIAVVSTLDNDKGDIVVAIAPGCEAMVEGIMDDLGRQFLIEARPDSGDRATAPSGT